MRNRIKAVVFLALSAASLGLPAATPAGASVPDPLETQLCEGGGDGTGERAIDTLVARLDLADGVLYGYWIYYTDHVPQIGPATVITAQPFFIALPPDARSNPGAYVYHLPYRENFWFDDEGLTTSDTAAPTQVWTYRDLPDRTITGGSAFALLGRIYGATGNFSTCQFEWDW